MLHLIYATAFRKKKKKKKKKYYKYIIKYKKIKIIIKIQ